jgi:hypothetical protein
MTEPEILNKVEEYFKVHNLDITRVDHRKVNDGTKSPDFKLYSSGILVSHIEVKSPLLLLNDKTQLFQWTTSVSKLRGFIHNAVKQFVDVDNDHSEPWLLVFTSDQMQLNWTNMIHAITGVVSHGNTITRDLRKERYVRETEEDVKRIDSFIWFQMNSQGVIHQVRFFINAESKFKGKCEEFELALRPQDGEPAYKK